MALRHISWPFPRLNMTADSVENITYEIRAIWQDIIDTLETMLGIGSVPPLIGKMLQLVVMDSLDSGAQAICMANIEVMSLFSVLHENVEASPKIYGVLAKLKRPKTITLRFLNDSGLSNRSDFSSLWSISLEHQIDQSKGKMCFDELSKVGSGILLRKARKTR